MTYLKKEILNSKRDKKRIKEHIIAYKVRNNCFEIIEKKKKVKTNITYNYFCEFFLTTIIFVSYGFAILLFLYNNQ